MPIILRGDEMPNVSGSIDLRSKNQFFNDLMSILDDLEQQAISAGADKMTGKREDARQFTEDVAKQVTKEIKKEKKKYSKERRELANKVSQMARTANKRLDRLQKNNLEGQSAYKAWFDDGAVRFSVKGKSYQELQKEYWRVQKFLDAQTSTIKGAKENMQRVAREVMKIDKDVVSGMSLQELNDATSNFFKIADEMQKHYEEINDNARRIDYQKIFQEIQQYFDIEELILMRQDADFDDLVDQMRNYFDKEQQLEQQVDLWE